MEKILCDLRNIFESYLVAYKASDFYDKTYSINDSCKDEFGNYKTAGRDLFYTMTDYYEYNKFPKCIPDEEFVKHKLPLLYHGFVKFDHAANYLTHWKYHYGNSIVGMDGFFLTPRIMHAKQYTVELLSFRPTSVKRVIPFYLNKGNTVKSSTLLKYSKLCENLQVNELVKLGDDGEKLTVFLEFVSSISDKKLAKSFFDDFTSNLSVLAIFLGYETILDDSDEKSDYIVSLKRSNLIVPKSYADCVLNKSKNYKKAKLSCFDTYEEALNDIQLEKC